METEWADLMMAYSWYVVLLPFLGGVLRMRQLTLGQKWLLGLVAVGLLTEVVSRYLATFYGNNMALSHVYVALEGMLISQIFFYSYPNFLPIRTLRIAQGLFLVFVAANVFVFQDPLAYSSYSRLLETLLMPLLAVSFFTKVLQRLDVKRIEVHPLFWVSVGVLCYFFGNLLLFVYAEFVQVQGSEIFLAIWGIHAGLMILLYLCYFVALLCPPPQLSPSYSLPVPSLQ